MHMGEGDVEMGREASPSICHICDLSVEVSGLVALVRIIFSPSTGPYVIHPIKGKTFWSMGVNPSFTIESKLPSHCLAKVLMVS
jgi:hypothetical protein